MAGRGACRAGDLGDRLPPRLPVHLRRRGRLRADPPPAHRRRGGPAGQMRQVVSEQPFQVRADVEAAPAHHLHARQVRVARPPDDLDLGRATPAHHEVADRSAQHLAQPHPALGQQREQQPVTQVACPFPGRIVPGGAAVNDRLDLLRNSSGGRPARRRRTLTSDEEPRHRRDPASAHRPASPRCSRNDHHCASEAA